MNNTTRREAERERARLLLIDQVNQLTDAEIREVIETWPRSKRRWAARIVSDALGAQKMAKQSHEEEATRDPWDLDDMDEEYEQAEEVERGEGDYENIPDGTYQVKVEGVELKKSQAGNTYLSWTLRILGPKYANRLLWRNNMMQSSKNLQWLKTDLSVCGVQLPKLSMLPTFLEELLDIYLEVAVKNRDENNQDVYFNKRISGAGSAGPSKKKDDDDDGLPF